MELQILLVQMGVVVVFLTLGYLIRRTEVVSAAGLQDISSLLVYVIAPAQLVSSVANIDPLPERRTVLLVLLLGVIFYATVIVLGLFMGRLCLAPKKDHRFYNCMTVFNNVGFIGLPLGRALFGEKSAVYLALLIVIFFFVMYTYAYVLLGNAEDGKVRIPWKKMINPAVISAVFILIVLLVRIPLPAVVRESAKYAGNCTTFLAIFILGANLVLVKRRDMLLDWHLYLFVAIRQVAFPIVFVLILKQFVHDPIIAGSLALCAAVPVGSSPVAIATANGYDLDVLTRGTTLSTILSVVTVIVVMMVTG